MLRQVAEDVLIHKSEFVQNNAVVVRRPCAACRSSTPGCTATRWTASLTTFANLGTPVVAGFSTHPHWDHLLWHSSLGTCSRRLRHGASARPPPEIACRTGSTHAGSASPNRCR